MRIAVIAPLDFGSSGGSFSYVETMATALLESSDYLAHDFTLFTHGEISIENAVIPQNITFRLIPSSSKVFSIGLMLKELINPSVGWSERVKNVLRRRSNLTRTLEIEKFDFVWFVAPAGEAVDVPFATTLWDLEFREQPFFPEVSAKGEWRKRQLQNVEVLQRAAFVVVGTEYGANQLTNYFGVDRKRIQLAPFSVQPQSLSQQAKREPNLIFFPAQFWPHKNHITLLKALLLARKKSGRNIRLVLPGSDKGNLSLVKKYVAAMGLGDAVDFPGFISNDELIKLYCTASLMVFPSLFGPDNLPPLEALTFGCRVIVADIPGAREQLGENVHYFEPFSEHGLADLIIQELDSRLPTPRYEGIEPQETLELILNRVSDFECYIRTWTYLQ